MNSSNSSHNIESSLIKVFQLSEPTGAIYVGTTFLARNFRLLKEKNINAVLSAQKQEKISLPQTQVPSYLYLEIEDRADFDISRFFQISHKFIEMNRRSKNILVHCSTGLNCSISLVLAYLIKKCKYTLQQAFTIIKKKHLALSLTEFNPGFVCCLKQFAIREADFSLFKENRMRRKIQRVRDTFDGIVRTYSKQLTIGQKLKGVSPSRAQERSRTFDALKSIKSQIVQRQKSKALISHRKPDSMSGASWQKKLQRKLIPKKSDEEIEDQLHHKKIVQEILMLSEESKNFESKHLGRLKSDEGGKHTYELLKRSKKNHLEFYSPLVRYRKYQLFTQITPSSYFQVDEHLI